VRFLGIESSCDETAAAVVTEDGLVLSDVVHSQVAIHAEYGGVVPELASRDHVRNVSVVVREALVRAGIGVAGLDAVAVTHRPGLVGALLVGVQAAKGIAWGGNKPLIGVDHLVGHLLAVFLRRDADAVLATPSFPFVCLLVSGGHTALYRVDAPHAGAVTELGATRDDAAGEAFDKVAKLLKLGYPGGPAIDRLAATGDATRAPKLSTPMAGGKSLEFSFSGIKTQVAQLVAKNGIPTGTALADLCAAFQTTVTDVLAKKLIEAATREDVSRVVIGGGVAANRELRRRVGELAAKRGMEAFVPEIASCTDNAAMIAYAGAMKWKSGAAADGWDLAATSATALPRETRKGGGARNEK
jgi:N6-L-threonylcarbamoyladenine synthase